MMRVQNILITDTIVSNTATPTLITPMVTNMNPMTITTTALTSHTALRTNTNSNSKLHTANSKGSTSSALSMTTVLTITSMATLPTLTPMSTKASTRSPRPNGDPNHDNKP